MKNFEMISYESSVMAGAYDCVYSKLNALYDNPFSATICLPGSSKTYSLLELMVKPAIDRR